jgi:ribose 5-phosphate isomerase B
MKPTVYLGADHAGFAMKESIKDHLELLGYMVEDLGAFSFDKDDDYPEYAANVAKAVTAHAGSFGILSCGNAEGICIAANKFMGIRAGIGYSTASAKTMRNDDDANILCVPGRLEIKDDPLNVVETFLATAFSNEERHKRRIGKIE